MSDRMTQQEAIRFFSEFYFGEHHLPADVKQFGPGWCINDWGDFATFDSDKLTRLVFLAHDRCVRVAISPAGPKRLKIAIWKRKGREGSMFDRHPTIEQALTRWRSSNKQIELTTQSVVSSTEVAQDEALCHGGGAAHP